MCCDELYFKKYNILKGGLHMWGYGYGYPGYGYGYGENGWIWAVLIVLIILFLLWENNGCRHHNCNNNF